MTYLVMSMAAIVFPPRMFHVMIVGSQEDWVWIEVRDNGRGMSAEAQRRVFQPSYAAKPVGKGTGLGMSVS